MGKYRLRLSRFIPALILAFCMAGLFLWGLWTALAWAKDAVLHQMLEVKFMAREKMDQTIPVRGMLIRDEEPFKAAAPGEITLKVRDGERLRVGTELAGINGVTNSTVYTPRAGIFCTHVDGLESLLVPEMIGELDLSAVETIRTVPPPADNQVDGGQFFGKVVDNLNPLLIHINTGLTAGGEYLSFKPGGTAYFIYEGQEMTGSIKEARWEGESFVLVLEMSDYPDEFIHRRHINLELVARRLSGWLLPVDTVVFKDGAPGIYVVSKQRVKWVPVSVNDRMGDTVSVTGDGLNDAVRYINNPGWAREGARLESGG